MNEMKKQYHHYILLSIGSLSPQSIFAWSSFDYFQFPSVMCEDDIQSEQNWTTNLVISFDLGNLVTPVTNFLSKVRQYLIHRKWTKHMSWTDPFHLASSEYLSTNNYQDRSFHRYPDICGGYLEVSEIFRKNWDRKKIKRYFWNIYIFLVKLT